MNWNHVHALRYEIEVLKSRLKEHDTGHLKTTIEVLQNRVKEIVEESCEVVLDSSYPDGDGYWK